MELDPEIKKQWLTLTSHLKSLGANIYQINLPILKLALPAYYILVQAEAMSNLSRYDGVRFGTSPISEKLMQIIQSSPNNIRERLFGHLNNQTFNWSNIKDDPSLLAILANTDMSAKLSDNALSYKELALSFRALFGPEVQKRIVVGSFVLSSEAYSSFYANAQIVRSQLASSLQSIFRSNNSNTNDNKNNNQPHIDFLLCPTSVDLAPSFQHILNAPPLTSYYNDLFTVHSNLAGLPSISVPLSLSKSGLPISLQLIGSQFSDFDLLKISKIIQNISNFDTDSNVDNQLFEPIKDQKLIRDIANSDIDLFH
jgi:aspartyl-tRNA(Asn)/glutamyl-tRNA(Gln) amidotransferase subunit A